MSIQAELLLVSVCVGVCVSVSSCLFSLKSRFGSLEFRLEIL